MRRAAGVPWASPGCATGEAWRGPARPGEAVMAALTAVDGRRRRRRVVPGPGSVEPAVAGTPSGPTGPVEVRLGRRVASRRRRVAAATRRQKGAASTARTPCPASALLPSLSDHTDFRLPAHPHPPPLPLPLPSPGGHRACRPRSTVIAVRCFVTLLTDVLSSRRAPSCPAAQLPSCPATSGGPVAATRTIENPAAPDGDDGGGGWKTRRREGRKGRSGGLVRVQRPDTVHASSRPLAAALVARRPVSTARPASRWTAAFYIKLLAARHATNAAYTVVHRPGSRCTLLAAPSRSPARVSPGISHPALPALPALP